MKRSTNRSQTCFVKNTDMDTYSPELAKLLHEARAMQPGGAKAERDDEKREQEAALEELAERISAARSIV
ncbi:MAG: hypothetical protein KGL70_09835 [Betaproteobacteria bacterium]|nr:hypothetical protein [Betaproteobacteria bacterium]